MQGFYTFAAIYLSTAVSPFFINALMMIMNFKVLLFCGSILYTFFYNIKYSLYYSLYFILFSCGPDKCSSLLLSVIFIFGGIGHGFAASVFTQLSFRSYGLRSLPISQKLQA